MTTNPMNDLIKSLSEKLGLPESTITSAVGSLMTLLKEKLPGADFEKLAASFPGLISQVSSTASASASGGATRLSGLIGLIAGQAGDLAKVTASLQEAGVPAEKILPLVQGFIEKAREVAGPETIAQIAESFPMLKGLLGRSAE